MVNAIFSKSLTKKEKSINNSATARIVWVVCVPSLCVKVTLEPTLCRYKAEIQSGVVIVVFRETTII